MSTQPIKKIFSTFLTVVFLGAVITSGWLPRSCPVLKKYTIGCQQKDALGNPKMISTAQKEINRIPHQKVATLSTFTAKAQDERSTTSVIFKYRSPDEDTKAPTAYLQFEQKDKSFKDYALISSPLLNNLKWPVVSAPNGPYLYQRSDTKTTIDSFLTSSPKASIVATDRVVAADLKLSADQYTPLENLATLTGIDYVLTSRPPTQKDGTWYIFNRRFDLTNISTTDVKISGQISQDSTDPVPFFLSEIHIDYANR